MSNSPIADLSYRHYDGPLDAVDKRWWSIAKMTMQVATKRRGFWGWSIFSAWWFIILLCVFWFMDNVLGNAPVGDNPFLKQINWRDQFFHGFSYSQLILFIVALVVGIGTIANDNRANAMLVYLSKPCSRFDYVFGKWLAIFILITSVSYIPMAIFYLYGYLSFGQYGFWTSAPWLFLKLIGVSACAGAVHASLAVGISSMFNQGRLAGAVYAGLYFMANIFTQIMGGFAVAGPKGMKNMTTQLFYASVDGIQIGLAKLITGSKGDLPFPGMKGGGPRNRHATDPTDIIIAIPNPGWIITVFVLVVIGGFAVAYSRIKAVEVVN